MSNKTIGHVLFAITLLVIFGAFAAYAAFYKTASFFIRDSVEKTILWSGLLDRQIESRK